ncbi:hypothetical protein FJZ31_03090 [Candidatus Poribacteria bacterium]|nr:hypothetical protein [Candidatus Poribacteria bacterium]
MTLKESVARIMELRIDALALTDHNYLWAPEELKSAIAELPENRPLILRGQETSCHEADVLVYGCEEVMPKGLLKEELVALVHEKGGVVVLAHPFRSNRRMDTPLEELKEEFSIFDAIEVYTIHHTKEEIARARWVVETLEIKGIAASDGHNTEKVGTYATRFLCPIRNEKELADALRNGEFEMPMPYEAGAIDLRR